MSWAPLQDFGIKYNAENGGPALEGLTDKIYNNTKSIKAYLIADGIPEVCESFYLVLCKKIFFIIVYYRNYNLHPRNSRMWFVNLAILN